MQQQQGQPMNLFQQSMVQFIQGQSQKTIQRSQFQPQQQNQFTVEKVIAQGPAGTVYLVNDGKRKYAIKRVQEDQNYKNRELEILQQIKHPHICQTINILKQPIDKSEIQQVDIVMNYLPDNLKHFIHTYKRNNETIPNLIIKLFAYQILRALTYLRNSKIIHRDLKPSNILLDGESFFVNLCDFGSAKFYNSNETSSSYICSRFYRAPELIFGSTQYDYSIDSWSFGCLLSELLLHSPIFQGENNVEQMMEIIKVIGTPTEQEITDMNSSKQLYNFPVIRKTPLIQIFAGRNPDPYLVNLISQLLVYSPKQRLTPIQALMHPYFDQLRETNFQIENVQIPNLFNFTEVELKNVYDEELYKLIPQWYFDKTQQLGSSDSVPLEPEIKDFEAVKNYELKDSKRMRMQNSMSSNSDEDENDNDNNNKLEEYI